MTATLTATLTGPQLALARRIVGLSQPALARSLGVSPVTLRAWEQHNAPIPSGLLPAIAAALWRGRQAQMARDLERFTQLHHATTTTTRSRHP